MGQAFTQVGTFVTDNLIAGNQVPLLTESTALAQGTGTLKRGTIISTTGEAIVTDGIPYGVLTDDVTLSSDGTVSATVYIAGEFNSDFMFVKTGEVQDHKLELRKLGIYVK